MKIGDKVRVQTIRIESTDKKNLATGHKKKPTREGTVIKIYAHHILVQYENYKESINFKDVFYPYDYLISVREGKNWNRLESTKKMNFEELGWC